MPVVYCAQTCILYFVFYTYTVEIVANMYHCWHPCCI